MILYLPLSFGIKGNSSAYDVFISDISFGGYEETSQPNISVQFQTKTTPIQNGSGGQYTVTPGLARPLGPVAFYANITAYTFDWSTIIPAHEDSKINCTGINIFAFLDMPKHYYRYTDTSATISTSWSTNGELDCLAAGCIAGENLTCHFKVDDSHMNSTEVTSTIPITYTPQIISVSLTPLISYTNTILNCSVNVTDGSDSDPLSYYYLYNDTTGTLQGWSSNSLLDCGAVGGCDKYDNITCYAIVSDSYVNSTINQSNTVEILNTPPTLTGVASNTSNVRYGDSINITGYGTGDIDTDTYRLECGNQSGLSDLCISGYGTGNRSCTFLAPWNDTSSHTVFCRLYDSENVSTQRTVVIGTDNSYPTVTLLTPTSGTIWNQSITITFEYNATDNENITLCNLVINGSNVDTAVSPQKDTTLNFTYPISYGSYVWRVDCTDNSSNTGSSQTWNFTQSILESFTINNIGVTGFEQVNSDYTHTRAVINTLTFAPSSDYCRYKTINATSGWTEWEQCSPVFEWILPENDGNYTVQAQINHTGLDIGVTTNLSDWIYLQKSGVDLDITPPEAFTIYDDGDYTNKNTSFHAKWDTPRDVEASILRKSLIYDYIIIDNTTSVNLTGWISTSSTEITVTGLNLTENYTYIIKVNATNPAGYSRQSDSNGIIIDITLPNMTGVSANPDAYVWTNSGTLFFNWTATDNLAGVDAFSMILDKVNDTIPDTLEENYTINKTFTGKSQGDYYFHIRAKDAAGNWGNASHFGLLRIDKTPPTRPIPTNPTMYGTGGQIIFYWSASVDTLSGFEQYNITIHDLDNGTNYTYNTTETNYSFQSTLGHNYYITINATDNAGNMISSTDPKTQPVQITSAKPNSTTTDVSQNPIIKVTTSKKASCIQNETNEKFIYTDSTYHETKLTQPNGIHSLEITCTDNDDYSDTAVISYSVNKAASPGVPAIGTLTSTLAGKTVSIPVTAGTVGQIKRERFRLFINGTEHYDFTVIDNDNAGNYTIQTVFDAPGQYGITVYVGGQNSTQKIQTITQLTLFTQISGVTSPTSESHLTYANISDKKAGLGAQARTVSVQSDVSNLKINASSEGKTYIFFTRENINVKRKNTYLEQNAFDEDTNTFGYQVDDDYKIITLLDYDTITIQGLELIQEGTYSLFFRNLGTNNSNTIIRLEIE